MKKYGGKVTNWQLHHLTVLQETIDAVYPNKNAKAIVFTGTIDDSPKFQDGFHMRSSLIVDINREDGIIETLNTIYHIDVESEGKDTFGDMGDSALSIFY